MREDDEDFLFFGIDKEIRRISYKNFDRIDWFQSRARLYFPFCLICGNGDILINVGFGGKELLGKKIMPINWLEMAGRSHEVFKRNKKIFG